MKRCYCLLVLIALLSCTKSLPVSTPHNNTTDALPVVEVPKAKNIILLIGDGMGLGQITGGMYLNKNRTNLEKFPVVGLHKSHSFDNLVTDSAAGATAFASGVKTVNGGIGMDAAGNIKATILEEAERKGLATGMVATSTIVHATPAAFIAHVPNRRQYEEIAAFFTKTEIDLFIGGGKSYFDRREDGRNLYEELRKRDYFVTDYFSTKFSDVVLPESGNFAFLTADKDPLPVNSGRDYLIPATKMALEFLESRGHKGFFLMIEGSQIDWGGHANDPEYVLSEFKEFDKVINICHEFAKKNGETLVIVTADHETGGFAINPESTMDDLKVAFTTAGHTAAMIPVFAYGPGAYRFSGIYDNTAIFNKMRRAFGWIK